MIKNEINLNLYKIAKDIFPFNRSLTGAGNRKTLQYFKKIVPELKIKSIKSGTKVFDWTVPQEWEVKDAYIKNSSGDKIVDYKNSNLHLLGYSTQINKKISFNELDKHLFSLPELPKAIPYRTSYYKKNWGFCISHELREKLNKKENYNVYIDSKFLNGNLNYGEILIKGKTKKEIFLSCNICHPSLGNNEISGPVVTIALAKWLKSINNYYSYRIIFIPETIGSIAYLKKNLNFLKRNVVAGYVITCVGDDNHFSLLRSKYDKNLSEKAARMAFLHHNIKPIEYSFLKRGSDERQYCSPGVDLPISSIMRSKYGEYKEYHTSLDNLDFISEKGLQGSFKIISESLKILEVNKIYKYTKLCEPFLTKYNLKKSISGERKLSNETNIINNLLMYSNGKNDLIEICSLIKENIFEVDLIANKLIKLKLLKKI